MNFKVKSRAFTLVEALVALSILTVGIISGFILVTKALYNVTIIQDRLTASFLAQEGIELVRQIRDSNYKKILNNKSANWDNGLSDGAYIISVDLNPPGGVEQLKPFEDKYLKYDLSSRLYNYNSGNDTVFKRKIIIIHIPSYPSNEIKVQSIMDWKSKNIPFSVTVEDHLFNWLQI